MMYIQGTRFNFLATKPVIADNVLATHDTLSAEAEDLAESYKSHADQLYKKADYDAATILYSKTIGHLEPSYVIRKFLDTQRIHNLASYLYELHKKGLANKDHTTLLINCYAKLKDTEKLKEFIQSIDKGKSVPDFDVETAIRVLRQASFFDHALYLASTYGLHEWYFKIQLEDKENAADVLNYIDNLPRDTLAAPYIIRYGRYLVAKEPKKTTLLVKKLCNVIAGNKAENFDQISNDFKIEIGEYSTRDVGYDDFLNIFVKDSEEMLSFIEYIIEISPESTTNAMYNTLLDLYLRSRKSTTDPDLKTEVELKILNLLKMSDADYDVQQAMVLCKMNNYDEGLLYLFQRVQLFHLITRFYMQKNDADMLLKSCEEFGDLRPGLWVDALWYFAENAGTNDQLLTVLQEIEKRKLLSGTSIIAIISKNPNASLAAVKDYLQRFLSHEAELISENDHLINQYKDDTDKMKTTIDDLGKKPKTFQAIKCSNCKQPLELPTVHFLCEHSFHQHCFESFSSDDQSDCPICRKENNRIINSIRSRENIQNLHEKFSEQISNSDADVISVISSYFSKGVFNSHSAPSRPTSLPF